ncbi:M24 family metallopeptidase [Chloroflexota bacterium]
MKVNNRMQKLRQKFAEKEIDAILISQPENIVYLSGFGGSGFLLITGQGAILATSFIYMEETNTLDHDYQILQINGTPGKWFPELISLLSSERLGFEAESTTFAMYRQLSNILKERQSPLELVPVNGLVESLRAVKEPGEIELITKAAEITDSAFAYIEGMIHTGMTEIEVAWELEKFMREHGSQTMPFEIIVGSGSNSALPHATPSRRVINSGEPIVIDMGAMVEGYSSDLTRTICLGTPASTFKKIYSVVLEAQLTAIAMIEEGMTGEQADSLARTVIESARYGKAFGHSLGHNIGLGRHENPRLGPGVTEVLTSGMVFTLEPGIYLPGWGGVRIEDLVVMEDGKVRIISRARKVTYD